MEAMETRRNAIVELVNKNGTVSFAQIRDAFPDVSEMTLRTDLKTLDEAKKILRIHGGAKSVQTIFGTDGLLSSKAYQNIAEKQLIAQKALSLLHEGTSLFLDSGSTTTAFAKLIPDQADLIYTTGLSCAAELKELSRPTVMIPGGQLNRFSQSVFGSLAVHELERVNFDQAFLGTTGFDFSAGFTCGISEEAILKQTAIRQADQVIVLMDSSKINVKCSFRFSRLSDVDIIVSDGNLPEEFLAVCREQQITVL
ncbi:MAG: DeoR/GlpR family DNA-binding transcription regulator [Clostridiales bacterium]|nr:DeoR/GlpR family DNA-binding transcription regulator [Clostridiales bacterium]